MEAEAPSPVLAMASNADRRREDLWAKRFSMEM
jgi:hypothetical protein